MLTDEDRHTAARQRCFERLRNSVITTVPREGDGALMVGIDRTMTMTLSELPSLMSDSVESRVIDVELMSSLCASKTINWCRSVRPIYPLCVRPSTESSRSRDSLLVAMTTAMWGSSDMQLVDMVRRLVYVAMTTRPEAAARLAERCIDQSDSVPASNFTRRQVDVARTGNILQWRQVIEVFSDESQSDAAVSLRPIHLFVLSNVLRRPIIVLGGLTADDLCGLYLPVLHSPAVCCRSPLVVVQVSERRYVPLVPRVSRRQDDPTQSGVPLWRADTDEPLLVRCLLDTESAQLALTTYLRLVELPHTSTTSTVLYPVAMYDVIAPDVNILDEYLSPATTEPDLLPVTVGCSDMQSMTGATNDVTCRPCLTAGCQYYALQQHDWKCSRCYANQSTSGQSASSSTGHVLQMTSHTKAQPMAEERDVQWNGELKRRDVICAVPSCDQLVSDDSQLYCLQHATRQRTQPCATVDCNRPAGDRYNGLCASCYVTAPRDVIVAMRTEPVRPSASCIMDFCSNVGSAECKGLCQQCFSALCQTRLQEAFDPPTTTVTSAAVRCGALAKNGRSVEATVKCMMEGCRIMVPASSEVCDTCRRKQLQAYEDVMRGHH